MFRYTIEELIELLIKNGFMRQLTVKERQLKSIEYREIPTLRSAHEDMLQGYLMEQTEVKGALL